MDSKIITINNVDIVSTKVDGQTLVPIRPICDALGVDYSGQLQKLKNDDELAPTVGLSPTVGADGKDREMVCLPLEFVFGWLFTINPANVKEEAREAVKQYRRECYHALFLHFFEKSEKYQDREKSFERTIALQNEQSAIRANPVKTADDFERYLEIEYQLQRETSIRKSLTRESITNLRTLF